jgi:hypothetical protein
MFVCCAPERRHNALQASQQRCVETEAVTLVTNERNIFSRFSVLNEKRLIGRGASCLPLSHRKHNASSFFFSAVPQQVNAPTN